MPEEQADYETANETMSAEEYRNRQMSEEAIHKAVVDWADGQAQAEPALELLFHCPNGGSRHGAEAKKLRQMGVRQGVPDLTLPAARLGARGIAAERIEHNGLALELKSPSGRLRPSQEWWLARLREQGWAVAVVWSVDRAIHVIQRYLSGEHEPQGLDLSGAEPPRHVE